MRTHSLRSPRLLAALVALCYAWLSLATSFQHNHPLGQESESALPMTVSSVRAAPVSGPTRIAAQSKIAAPDSCLACQWQAANASPAQPVQLLASVPPVPAPRVVTTLPRYLPFQTLARASRGPPSA